MFIFRWYVFIFLLLNCKFTNNNNSLIEFKSVSKVFLPLICTVDTDKELEPIRRMILLEIIKILVMLTMPLKSGDERPLERTRHLQEMKSGFTSYQQGHALTILASELGEPLSIDSKEREEEDSLFVELTLWLVRNLLCIPDSRELS